MEVVLESGIFSSVDGGPQVHSLEEEFASFSGRDFCIGVSSGSTALLVALAALDLKNDDEVIVPAYTFIADLLSVMHSGARPIFADIDPNTYALDPDDFERRITPQTRAVIVVHLFGRPADMTRICEIADRHDIVIIEDCCQAHGAEFNGKRVGTFGTIACYSFSQGHILSGGTGGAIVTNSPELADAARRLRFFGVSTAESIQSDDDRDYDRLGFNYALNEFSAALVRLQLPRINEIINAREVVASTFWEHLCDLSALNLVPYQLSNWRVAHHVFPIRLSEDAGFTRSQLVRELRKSDVGFLVTYPRALNQLTVARDLAQEASMPISEEYARRTVGLYCAGTVSPSTAAQEARKVRTIVEDLTG